MPFPYGKLQRGKKGSVVLFKILGSKKEILREMTKVRDIEEWGNSKQLCPKIPVQRDTEWRWEG